MNFQKYYLVTIYEWIIRSHANYGNVNFEKAFNHTFHCKLEPLQYNAKLAKNVLETKDCKLCHIKFTRYFNWINSKQNFKIRNSTLLVWFDPLCIYTMQHKIRALLFGNSLSSKFCNSLSSKSSFRTLFFSLNNSRMEQSGN